MNIIKNAIINEFHDFYRSTNLDHCLFIFRQAPSFISGKTPTVYRVLGFCDFV